MTCVSYPAGIRIEREGHIFDGGVGNQHCIQCGLTLVQIVDIETEAARKEVGEELGVSRGLRRELAEAQAIVKALSGGPGVIERRRYALLNAAAVLRSAIIATPGRDRGASGRHLPWSTENAVAEADTLLGLIERREAIQNKGAK